MLQSLLHISRIYHAKYQSGYTPFDIWYIMISCYVAYRYTYWHIPCSIFQDSTFQMISLTLNHTCRNLKTVTRRIPPHSMLMLT